MGAHQGAAALRPFEVRRLAAISLHTSPLAQPGTGDAGGMNIYVDADRPPAGRPRGRGRDLHQGDVVRPAAGRRMSRTGVLVRHIVAGPFEGLHKEDLPGQLCSFAAGVMRAPAPRRPGFYDVVHSHYWLSGQVGFLAKDRWGVPLVHSAHTLARVKNAALADDDEPEPQGRLIGEDQVVAEADRLIANTDDEAARPDRAVRRRPRPARRGRPRGGHRRLRPGRPGCGQGRARRPGRANG